MQEVFTGMNQALYSYLKCLCYLSHPKLRSQIASCLGSKKAQKV